MDDLENSFGRLSTAAPVWKPGGGGGAAAATATATAAGGESSTVDSDLKASTVQEFVPGRAWGSGGPPPPPPQTAEKTRSLSGASSTPNAEELQQQHQEQYGEDVTTTVPSGPSPAPTPSFRALQSLGLSPDLWRHFRELSSERIRQMDPSDPMHKAVPLPYCNAYCLDSNPQQRSSFGYPCATFQVTNREDGNLYVLHRFDGVRSVSPKIAAAVTDRWTASAAASAVQEHPGVVPFYLCFLAQRAVFFVHQYVPGSRTLQERLGGQPLAEPILWSCLTQIVSALRKIHGAGLAARSLDAAHVLSVPDPTNTRLRVRLNCLGVADVLEFEARKHVAELQQQDVRSLGRLILSLATGTDLDKNNDADTVMQCEAFLAQSYSPELHNLTMTLCQSARPPSIDDVSRVLWQRCYDEQDAAYSSLDRTEEALASEYESGRALRLLLKLGFVNERPEFGPNRRWSQSGDCYVLTLFRDFVFHQADGAGNPVMDLGHVVTAMNKLDAADEEKIVLSSRDGKSLMVVSYADVARCLESAFQELCSGSVPPAAAQY